MKSTHIKADYLIVGSGAVGMAFADTLLAETEASVIIVDQFSAPGGHWNVAYPFVTLHQPSQFYGVNSKELSTGEKDKTGLNKGLYDLASGAQVMAYYDSVMRHTFLPTGRVQYFPMCNYTGDRRFTSKITGEIYDVSCTKIVDATHLKTTVPSTHTPNFEVDGTARFMPLNDLPNVTDTPEGFVIIGGGKTGVDACLWLLDMGVDPDRVTWIVSRDAWLLNRKNTQPSEAFFFDTMGAQAGQFESIAMATSKDDMFDRLEACGYFLRLDPSVRPTMFHGATISEAELAQLRRIKNVVRMGRVCKITRDSIILDKGSFKTSPKHVHIDCSASAITNYVETPIFDGDLITPQMVRSYQPVFSAAFIAHLEAAYNDNETKNKFAGLVPLPNTTDDYIRMTAAMMMNQYVWGQEPDLRAWMLGSRLDGFSNMVASINKDESEKRALMARLRNNAMPAMGKLQAFIAQM